MDLTGAVWRKSSRSGPEGDNRVEVAALWRKSSRSGVQGDHCVEVSVLWRMSSRSGPNGDACVEVADLARVIAARDSKDPRGPHLRFDRPAFARLLDEIKAGEHDLA